jgi:hypothetical protein
VEAALWQSTNSTFPSSNQASYHASDTPHKIDCSVILRLIHLLKEISFAGQNHVASNWHAERRYGSPDSIMWIMLIVIDGIHVDMEHLKKGEVK